MNEVQMYSGNMLSEFRNEYEGKQRWAQLLQYDNGYTIQCLIDYVYQGSRSIKGHSLQYAEDAAENFVLGLYDKPLI